MMRAKQGFMTYGAVAVTLLVLVGIALTQGDIRPTQLRASPADTDTRFTYTYTADSGPLNIGAARFISERPRFTCTDYLQSSPDAVHYPEPRPSCWEIPVLYQGEQFMMTPSETYQLSDTLTVSADIEDLHADTEGRDTDWETTFSFRLSPNALDTSLHLPKEQVALNENNSALLRINNPLPDFSSRQAGVWVRYKHGLLPRGEAWESQELAIRNGNNSYQVPLDTSELGGVTVSVQPFVTINADEQVRLYASNAETAEYRVSQEVQIDRPEPWHASIWNWITGWFN